jgi:hypothetical protein
LTFKEVIKLYTETPPETEDDDALVSAPAGEL